jgi:hypothetical protein
VVTSCGDILHKLHDRISGLEAVSYDVYRTIKICADLKTGISFQVSRAMVEIVVGIFCGKTPQHWRTLRSGSTNQESLVEELALTIKNGKIPSG